MTQRTATAHITTGRMKSIKRVLWAIFFLNLAVALAKYVYGLVSHSASMQADGIHSIFDSFGNLIGIVGITIAARPADDSHPYGHAKFETSASVVIGVLLLMAAFNVATSAIASLYHGTYGVQVTPLSFAVMIFTLCVNLGVTYYERRKAKELQSEILGADANHTLSDALVSVGVIVGLAFAHFGFPVADPIMAIIVSAAILKTAIDVFKTALDTLSDHARLPEEDIRACVMGIDDVRSVHRIRTRGTEAEVYVDLHLLVDPNMTVSQAHDLSETIEGAVGKRFPQVAETLVHIEPDDGHVD